WQWLRRPPDDDAIQSEHDGSGMHTMGGGTMRVPPFQFGSFPDFNTPVHARRCRAHIEADGSDDVCNFHI
ncbi:hypothetical protein AB4144_23945, partial [Rhizobiaceae sp. 2RAB30]